MTQRARMKLCGYFVQAPPGCQQHSRHLWEEIWALRQALATINTNIRQNPNTTLEAIHEVAKEAVKASYERMPVSDD